MVIIVFSVLRDAILLMERPSGGVVKVGNNELVWLRTPAAIPPWSSDVEAVSELIAPDVPVVDVSEGTGSAFEPGTGDSDIPEGLVAGGFNGSRGADPVPVRPRA